MPSADTQPNEPDGRIELFGVLPHHDGHNTPRTSRRNAATTHDEIDQIALFATYGEPDVDDLQGLLLGPAQVVSRFAPPLTGIRPTTADTSPDTRLDTGADTTRDTARSTAGHATTDDDQPDAEATSRTRRGIHTSRATRAARTDRTARTTRTPQSRATARTAQPQRREARLSVVVDESWRTIALVSAFELRGLAAEPAPNPTGGGTTVRSRFGPELATIARRWTRGSRKRIPDGFGMTPAHLRLWAIAAGRPDPNGYLFPLGGSDEQIWEPVGALFTTAGLTSRFVGVRGGGPAYRISGRRALRRLADLLGEPPPEVPHDAWPL